MRVPGAIFAICLSGYLFGQTNATAPSFRAESNLVVIPVSVTDPVNRFVLGLRKEDFKLFDNGVEQPIAHFSGEDVPLSIGLAFDTSSSMDFKMRTSRDAATTMLKTMGPDDEAFLASFNDKVALTVPFTSKAPEIRDAVLKLQASGTTALLDAVKFVLNEMKSAKNARKAIVIVSDGGDNSSKYTAAQIEALVREADVEIYAMGVFDPLASLTLSREEVSGPKLLSEIASQTGGRAFAATISSDLPSVAARIAIELRNQYVIGYYPANQVKDGKYHTVEVKVSQPVGVPPLKMHWRQGYYAPSEK
ncbi:MAG: VWA domain-containing protein [Ignavibacteriota bacterium]